MNRQQIDALVKQMNVDTAKGEVDARVQQIVVPSWGFISSHRRFRHPAF